MLDVLTAFFLSVAAGVTGALLSTWHRLVGLFRKIKPRLVPRGIYASRFSRSATVSQ